MNGSVAFSNPRRASLHDAFTMTRVAIFQSITPSAHPVEGWREWASYYASEFFRLTTTRKPGLLYVDEMYDVMHGTNADAAILRAIRAGRERGLAVLVGAQRPRWIPLSILTECTVFYTFHLEYVDDVKYLRRFGPPLEHIPTAHDFDVYRQRGGGRHTETLMRLNLHAEKAS